MKTTLRWFVPAVGLAVAALLLPAAARAECGLTPAAWEGHGSSADPIVGMWQVTFTAQGNPPGGPPDGAVLDNAFAQWHSDGTEIMNSSRNPVTQSYCLGVWEGVGHRRYRLNHFGISWDPTVPDHPLGPANIREDVTLSSDGKTFSGTFTIDQYDDSKNLLAHLAGQVQGRRITVDTTGGSLS